MRKLMTGLALGVVLTGCGTIFNGDNQALTVAERHPITVDQQTVSLSIPVDSTLNGLSRESHAELDRFLTVYRTRGHGPVTVMAPSGGSNDIDGQQRAADVRLALNSLGLAYSDMRGATYRSGERQPEIVVTFTQYVASGPVCGNFVGDTISQLRNLPPPNFGCADQSNLAAMVADPGDLARMTPMAPSNGTAAAAAVRSLVVFENNGERTIDGAGSGLGEQ